jgi:hypothetical protein
MFLKKVIQRRGKMANNIKKLSNKTRAILIGIFILVAYGVLISSLTQLKIIVMIADVISGLAVICIAVLMFPLFKQLNKSVSRSYLILKYIEGILMIIAGLLFLITSLQYMRDIIYNGIHVYIFILGSFIFYYSLYKSKLIPRFISVWGALGIIVLLVSTLLKLANMNYSMIDYLLVIIITNEIFLSIWLMIKGFNPTVMSSLSS